MTAYFELSWSVLSTIGIANSIFSLIIISITTLSALTLVPLVVSIAGAVANGLCYYAFYTDYPTVNRVVASAVADLMWMVQEAGISFYGYTILIRILGGRSRGVFIGLFWAIMLAIFSIRIAILTCRMKILLDFATPDLQASVNRLHVCYFTAIALVECLSAYFLIVKFASAKKSSGEVSLGTGVFQHAMRSTEIRLATLALTGVSRAVTYYFQPSLQSATTVASQLDRFVYTLESLFPVMLFIDILASRLRYSNEVHRHGPKPTEARKMSRPGCLAFGPREDDMELLPTWRGVPPYEGDAEVKVSSSLSWKEQGSPQEPPKAKAPNSNQSGITKTVEFGLYENRS